jgi:hypothetical protein
MAQPKIFVPGPSVNSGLIGSPVQYIRNLQAQTEGFAKRAQDARDAEALEAHRQNVLNLETREQEFREGADERARAEKALDRKEASERAQANFALRSGDFAFMDSFLQNPETQKLFTEMGVTDPAAQREQALEFARKNPSLMRDPQQYFNTIYSGVLANKGTAEEAQAEATAAVGQDFSTLDPTIVSKLVDTGSNGTSSLIGSLFKGSTSAGKPVQSVPTHLQQQELNNILTGRMSIEDRRGGGIVDNLVNFFDVGDKTRSTFDVGARDLDLQDIQTYVGEFGSEFPEYAIVGAMQGFIDPDDGTMNQRVFRNILDNPDSQDAKDFRSEMKDWQAQAERNRVSGNLSGLSANEVLGLVGALQGQRNAFNMDLISRTAPQTASFANRLAAFRKFSGLGPAQAAQGPVAPVVTPPPTVDTPTPGQDTTPSPSGSSTLDNLISNAAAQGNIGNTAIRPGDASPLFTQAVSDSAGAPPGRDAQIAQQAIIQPQIDARVSELEQEIKSLEALPFQGAGVEETIRSMKEEIRELKRRN